MLEFLKNLSTTDGLFLTMAACCAVIGVLGSYWAVDYGLAEVTAAAKIRDRAQRTVNSLKQARDNALSTWEAAYSIIRHNALEVIEEGRGLADIYRQTFHKYSKYGSQCEFETPDATLPPQLANTEPPTLDQDKEDRKS